MTAFEIAAEQVVLVLGGPGRGGAAAQMRVAREVRLWLFDGVNAATLIRAERHAAQSAQEGR